MHRASSGQMGVYQAQIATLSMVQTVSYSGAVGGKTGKTAVLPRFCKIGRGGGRGGAPPYYGGLSWPVRARRAGGAAVKCKEFLI